MEILERLGLRAATKRRYTELRAPPADWRDSQRLSKQRRAWAADLLGVVDVDDAPTADELVHCAERIQTGSKTESAADHLEARRAAAHQALGTIDLELDVLVVAAAHIAVDETLDVIGNLRKPVVIALTCLLLALHDTTVEQLRRGRGPMAGGPGRPWGAIKRIY